METSTQPTAMDTKPMLSFRLDDEFINTNYRDVEARTGKNPFTGNLLGEYVYRRTYQREGETCWIDTIRRVVEGQMSILKDHRDTTFYGWSDSALDQIARKTFDLEYNMKFLPPGRGLFAMGSTIVHEKKLGAALNNCAFGSTANMDVDPTRLFTWLMDASMLGVGVGFDTKGSRCGVTVNDLSEDKGLATETFVVPDSREGWVESLDVLLTAYLVRPTAEKPLHRIRFDYSQVRPAGKPLRGFGGVASGPGPLKEMHERLIALLDAHAKKTVDSRLIVDIANIIGACVVSGNIRRTAEIALGESDDVSFLDAKDYEKNPYRCGWGYTSNNSVFAEVGMNYDEICRRIALNGEPGLVWMGNMQKYDRMNGVVTNKDAKAAGVNPCNEQTLEPFELCCLVEVFIFRHTTLSEFLESLRHAHLYAKTVTLLPTHWPETNEVMARNRRMGVSVSGIAQFLDERGEAELIRWLEAGYAALQTYDRNVSPALGVPESIKLTSVKPSGTVSLLANATPGVHRPISTCYKRRVRDAKGSALLKSLQEAGYVVEPAVYSEATTSVVEFYVRLEGRGLKTIDEVTMEDQLKVAALLQKHWADNQVSVTVSFDPVQEGPIMSQVLSRFDTQLKGCSLLPKDTTYYPQAPYERISEEDFLRLSENLREVVWPVKKASLQEEDDDDEEKKKEKRHERKKNDEHDMPAEVAFCDGDTCYGN